MRFFKKKAKPEDDILNEELLHNHLGEIVRIVDQFIRCNSYPEVTLYLALKCYKMIEREHRKLGTKYLKERIDLGEGIIQI